MREHMSKNEYDAIVIGGGHAGCEAALALARKGYSTLCMAINLDSIALMACNPAIGGTSKGHLVREVDALGGQIGLCADACFIQSRMLNTAKGPAVHSLRAQEDKKRYTEFMKMVLENQLNLQLIQSEASEILVEAGKLKGVRTTLGMEYYAKVVILACGVYLQSRIITGESVELCGPSGLMNAKELSYSIEKLGLQLMRFKTGTPPRIMKDGVDFKRMKLQPGDDIVVPFSFMTDAKELLRVEQLPCYMTYTNGKTHDILRANLHRSPMYSGVIDGTGARYCPSVEDKIVRFADKDRHQVFIEPEGRSTGELYLQGFSTSMPAEVQQLALNTIEGLESARIARFGYAIEYDCIDARELKPTLEYKQVEGLFFAGQICGSSGYEEAAAQGIMAGINATMYLEGKPGLVLKRSDAYIGVLIDDLVTKGTNEPYRMMTSRAEYRLLLRQDNADLRLTEYGRQVGLVNDARYSRFKEKQKDINRLKDYFRGNRPDRHQLKNMFGDEERFSGINWWQLLQKGDDIQRGCLELFSGQHKVEVLQQISIDSKYEGYIQMQMRDVEKMLSMERRKLPEGVDYDEIKALRIEARQKLKAIMPQNIGQASRISGVSPADIMVLCVWLDSRRAG